MNTFTQNLLQQQQSSVNNLTPFQLAVIDCYESYGLLEYKQLENMNAHLGDSLIDLVVHCSFPDFLVSLFAAAEQETLTNLCLHMEMFVKTFDPKTPVYEGIRLNLFNLGALLEKEYHTLPGFAIFHPQNVDYKNPGNSIYKNCLSNLHTYCGIKDAVIEAFFEADFQEFFDFFVNAANALGQDRVAAFIALIQDKLPASAPVDSITTLAELNAAVLEKETELLVFLDYLLSNFAKIRHCTTAVVETLMQPVHLSQKVLLQGPGKVNNHVLDLFNSHLGAVLNDANRTFAVKDRKQVTDYLTNDFRKDRRMGGFVAVVKRQTVINEDAGWGKNPFTYVLSDQQSMDIAAKHYQLNTEDLQTMTRINFVLENRAIFTDEEWVLVAGKIVPLLKSISSSYFSDVFELYFVTVMKKSGLVIWLIPSKTAGGQDVSTCDYKIGDSMGADAKCLIGGNIGFNQISYWINEAGGQVESSIGWEGITFGGAVIGIRDKRFNFLNPLKQFAGKDPFNEKERIPVFKLFYELYAEFRRHTETNPEQIKFIVFYYLPETDLPVFKYGMQAQFTPDTQQELMFVFSTKYASADEIEQLKQQFKPVANFLFQFNNDLN